MINKLKYKKKTFFFFQKGDKQESDTLFENILKLGTTMVCGKVLWFHGHIPIVFPEGVVLRQKLIRTQTNME